MTVYPIVRVVPLTQVCIACKTEKPASEFTPNERYKSGLDSSCKSCFRIKRNAYNRERLKDAETRAASRRTVVKWIAKRRAEGKRTKPESTPESRAKKREARRIREQNDPLFRLSRRLRSRVINAVKHYRKAAKTMELVGCSLDELRTYLVSKFLPGMTWENHGQQKHGEPPKWHIDHIIPCAAFDLSDPEQQRKCFHYSNLQPLWAFDNMSKGAKYDSQTN